MGNITSVINAVRRLNFEADLVSIPDQLSIYNCLILPGVGAFGKAMTALRETGMDIAIRAEAKQGKKIVGICLGMQLLFSSSEEFGSHEGLGLIEGKVMPFEEKIDLAIPHMGWNHAKSNLPDFEDFQGDYYFVHSFYCKPRNAGDILLMTDYGTAFCSGVMLNNQIFGLQFHPEKSQKLGLSLLEKVLTVA